MVSPNPSSTTYVVLRIPPASPRIAELVAKYKAFKLAALLESAVGFAVKHADEVLLPLSVWEQRLAAPSTILICVATPSPAPPSRSVEDILLEDEWIGMSTLRGPRSWGEHLLPDSGQPIPEAPERETYWYICNLYTSPANRGKGLATRLVHASVDTAREKTKELGEDKNRARVRLFFDPRKDFLAVIYTKLGFSKSGTVSLREGFVANGDEKLLPNLEKEEVREAWERRIGVCMEKVVDV